MFALENPGEAPADFAEYAAHLREEHDDPMAALGGWRPNEATRFIRGNPECRATVEQLLYERAPLSLIKDSIAHRFKAFYSEEEIDAYRALYWDVDSMTGVQIAQHLQQSKQLHLMPKKPSMQGRFREAYVAFEAGYAESLDMDAAMRHMFARNFFESEKVIRELGIAGIDLSVKLQGAATSIYNSLQKTATSSGAAKKLPQAFDVEIEYMDSTAIPQDMVAGYDPEEDDGSALAPGEYEAIKQRLGDTES